MNQLNLPGVDVHTIRAGKNSRSQTIHALDSGTPEFSLCGRWRSSGSLLEVRPPDVSCRGCRQVLAARGDLDGAELVPPPSKTCTPAEIGSGPHGETCGGCHYLSVRLEVAGRYLKCDLMRYAWTRRASTDIRANWDACSCWWPKRGMFAVVVLDFGRLVTVSGAGMVRVIDCLAAVWSPDSLPKNCPVAAVDPQAACVWADWYTERGAVLLVDPMRPIEPLARDLAKRFPKNTL